MCGYIKKNKMNKRIMRLKIINAKGLDFGNLNA